MVKKFKLPSDKALKWFCKAHYYTDAETKWEPFENWPDEDLEEQIDIDIAALKLFLTGKRKFGTEFKDKE